MSDPAISALLSNEVLPCIKGLAREKILSFLPEWKQSNCLARMSELTDIRMARDLTADEEAEASALRDLWTRAKAIREASNVHEAAIGALTDIGDVRSYDYSIGWPE